MNSTAPAEAPPGTVVHVTLHVKRHTADFRDDMMSSDISRIVDRARRTFIDTSAATLKAGTAIVFWHRVTRDGITDATSVEIRAAPLGDHSPMHGVAAGSLSQIRQSEIVRPRWA